MYVFMFALHQIIFLSYAEQSPQNIIVSNVKELYKDAKYIHKNK